MNNEQFRRLISSNPSASPDSTAPQSKPRTTLLGARPKSSNPQSTGRSYGANLFKKSTTTNEPKKQRTNVPKGTKLAAGYVDRTQLTRADEEDDEIAQRLKALEEQVKEGELDPEEFERIRDEITGGDISKTHLVKGLDRKLLERIRRGENVLEEKKANEDGGEVADDDDAFEELEGREVQAQAREEKVKQGEKAKFIPPAAVAGQKRSRDQILADMKAAREATKAAARPQLGSGFKKIRKDEGPRIEVDEKGREVLITVDEKGNVKRRVRKAKANGNDKVEAVVEKPRKAKEVQPLGADVVIPTYEPRPEEESDDDIFAGAGHDFNPLADLEDASDTEEVKKPSSRPTQDEDAGSEEGDTKSPSQQVLTDPRKNYFGTAEDPSLSILSNIKNDFSTERLASLAKSQRAQELSQSSQKQENETEEEKAKRKRREEMLNSARRDRDMEDMDMGFGGSRDDDAEEMATDGTKVKLAKWRGLEGGSDDEEGGGKGGGKRKRGPKKRKGDKNSAADVLGEMERQRGK